MGAYYRPRHVAMEGHGKLQYTDEGFPFPIDDRLFPAITQPVPINVFSPSARLAG